jgi:DNA-binding NarL/FixJ family response regulator
MPCWAERAELLLAATTEAQSLDGLTSREIEVLQLIASGRTSKDIATELVLSVATVQRHVANIYTKIGARGRADAAAYALRRGLLP